MMDVINGDIPREGHPEFRPRDLFALWEEHRVEYVSSQLVPSSAGHSRTASSENTLLLPQAIESINESPDDREQTDTAPLLGISGEPVKEGDQPLPAGTVLQFIVCAVIYIFFPILVPVTLYVYPRTRRALAGALIGATVAVSGVFISMLLLFSIVIPRSDLKYGSSWEVVVIFLICSLWGISTFGATLYYIISGKDLRIVGHFVCGGMLHIFFLPVLWFKRSLTAKQRYAGLMGFASFVLVLSSNALSVVVGCINPEKDQGQVQSCSLLTALYFFAWFLLIACGILYVNLTRYRSVATEDRITSSSFVQGLFVFLRAMQQQIRYPIGFCFDIFLPILSAVFLGLIYHGRVYTPPIITALDPNATNIECPPPVNFTLPPQFAKMCPFLLIPADDPILPAASLTSMAVGLAAVASSIRVFASERVIFRREARAKLSTEAYYIGKSLAHLVNITLASLSFTIFYHSFVIPLDVPFWKVYLLYFSVYFTCAGLAYLVSFLVPANLAQLAGVLMILIFMMFSGANPTLSQLKHNKLLPFIMVVPSFISLFRWTNELYYLIMVLPYNPLPHTLTLYGYAFHDTRSCILMILLLAVGFRILAYMAVVWQEV